MAAEDLVLRTERLMLRAYRNSDLSALVELLGDPDTTRHLFSGEGMGETEVARLIETEFTFGAEPTGLGTLEVMSTRQVIGFAGMLVFEDLGDYDLEFGFAIATTASGQGYATEIGRCQIEYGFRSLQMHRLLALAHPSNSASQRVLRKLGMHRMDREREVRKRGKRDVFVIARSDWESADASQK